MQPLDPERRWALEATAPCMSCRRTLAHEGVETSEARRRQADAAAWPLGPEQAARANRAARRLLALAVIRVLADARREESVWMVIRRLSAALQALEERLPARFRELG